jgi:phosphopantothenoylcysteine decarboxylase/phosphopantothenate--cysteine ligase
MSDSGNDKPLSGYEVLLCVTGGIACYKTADLASKLVQAGAGVNVAMTRSATKFVGPMTFQALIQRQVHTSIWVAREDYRAEHLSLTEQADLMVVAPATANVLARFAHGMADDLIGTMALSATGSCPLLIAPAMNTRMWSAPAVQANVKKLKEWGMHFVGPEEGALACRTIGVGRMSEPADILDAASKLLLTKPPKRLSKGA